MSQQPPSEITFLGEMEKLHLEPGDVLVLHTDQHISLEQMSNIQEAMAHTFGNRKFVVLDKGWRLGAVCAAIAGLTTSEADDGKA